MIRWALVAFLFAHGWVHLVVWGLIGAVQPQAANPGHSWILGNHRAVSTGLTVAAAVLFALAAVGLALQAAWWGPVTVAASAVSLLLVALFPAALANAWVFLPLAIDLSLIVGIVWYSWPNWEILGG